MTKRYHVWFTTIALLLFGACGTACAAGFFQPRSGSHYTLLERGELGALSEMAVDFKHPLSGSLRASIGAVDPLTPVAASLSEESSNTAAILQRITNEQLGELTRTLLSANTASSRTGVRFSMVSQGVVLALKFRL